jgi:hypothetical protein
MYVVNALGLNTQVGYMALAHSTFTTYKISSHQLERKREFHGPRHSQSVA